MIGTQMTEPPPSYFGGSNQLHRNWNWKNNVPNGFLPQPPTNMYLSESWRNNLNQVAECVILDQDPHSFVPPAAQREPDSQTFKAPHYNIYPNRNSVDEGALRLEPPPTPPNLAPLIDDRFLYPTSSGSRPNSSLASCCEGYQQVTVSGQPSNSQHSCLSTNNEHHHKNNHLFVDSKRWENRQRRTPSPRRSPDRRKRSRSPDISEREPRERERRRSPDSYERNRMWRNEEKSSKSERRSNELDKRKSSNDEVSKWSPEIELKRKSPRTSDSRNRFSYKRSPDRSSFSSRRRNSSDRSSREGRKRRKEKDYKNDKRQKKSEVESELEAFAKQHDPEALLEKLKQKKMDQIKNSLLEKRAVKMNNAEENNSETNPEIKIEVDGLNEEEFDERDDSPATSDETIEDIYPWYIGAPLQNQIHDAVFYAEDEDLYRFDGRPQKQQEDDLFRSFPLKKRELFSEKVVELDFSAQLKKIPTNRTEILRQDESGVVIRRGGSYSWVSRKIMTSNIPEAISQSNGSNESPRLTSNGGSTPNIMGVNDCFEFSETQNCSAGLLCKYDHNGNGDHRKVKFCKRLLLGLCRNDDSCPNGSHALLKHQMPVCDYYWRRKCYLFQEQCPYLHVKTSASTPLCIHFNKGKCLSQQPVCLI